MRYIIISYGVGLVLLGLYPLHLEYGSLASLAKEKTAWIASGEWIPDSVSSGEEVGFKLGGNKQKSAQPFRLQSLGFAPDSQLPGTQSRQAAPVPELSLANKSQKSWSFWDLGAGKDKEKNASDSMNARDRDELRALLGEVEE